MNKVIVHKIPWPNIPNAYLLLSVNQGKERYAGDVDIQPLISFFFDNEGKSGAEWEPKYGPIQYWEVPSGDISEVKTREHYFYDKVIDNPLSWSQLAVEDEGLKDALLAGNMLHVFSVLKSWAKRNEVE